MLFSMTKTKIPLLSIHHWYTTELKRSTKKIKNLSSNPICSKPDDFFPVEKKRDKKKRGIFWAKQFWTTLVFIVHTITGLRYISWVPFRYFTRTASSIDACKGFFFFSSTEAYFNHAVITARWLVRVGLKNEPMHGSGKQANGYAACHSPAIWEGLLAI